MTENIPRSSQPSLFRWKHSAFPTQKKVHYGVFFILGAASVSVRDLKGFDKYCSVPGSLTGWRDQLFRQATLSLPDHFLKSSHYVAIWPTPLWCFCTAKRWNSPTIVPCWKATTHTYWFYAISHKLRHAHSKSLIFQTRVQAIDMGNDCRTNEPFPSSEFFPIFVVFLMWFIQTRTRQMQGPLANESLGIIYLLWKQLCEPKMGNKAVYRNNLSLGNLLSRRCGHSPATAQCERSPCLRYGQYRQTPEIQRKCSIKL